MAKVLTGSRVVVKIGETPLALASNLNLNIEYTLQDVDVLGRLEVFDLAEVGHRVNFSVGVFKPLEENLTQTAKNLGLENALESMKNQGTFDFIVMGPQDKVMYKIVGCKFEGGSGTVDPRGIWTGTWNFRGVKAAIDGTQDGSL